MNFFIPNSDAESDYIFGGPYLEVVWRFWKEDYEVFVGNQEFKIFWQKFYA